MIEGLQSAPPRPTREVPRRPTIVDRLMSELVEDFGLPEDLLDRLCNGLRPAGLVAENRDVERDGSMIQVTAIDRGDESEGVFLVHLSDEQLTDAGKVMSELGRFFQSGDQVFVGCGPDARLPEDYAAWLDQWDGNGVLGKELDWSAVESILAVADPAPGLIALLGLAPPRHKIYLSYANEDEKWLKQVCKFLRRVVPVWSRKDIPTGADRTQHLEKAVGETRFAVLLVSQDYLVSNFVEVHELGPFLEARKRDEVVIYWLPVGYSNYKGTALEDIQPAHDPDRPFNDIRPPKREKALVHMAEMLSSHLASNGDHE